MMSKKPTDYNQIIKCCRCGKEITDDVYIDNDDSFDFAHCFDCYSEMSEGEDGEEIGDWDKMSTYEYLDEANDRAYEAYVDRCVDEERERRLGIW